jgi:hypothetical protein
VGVLLDAQEIATPAPFGALEWRWWGGNPRERPPAPVEAEGPRLDEKRCPNGRHFRRVEAGWAEEAVWSLRPWDAVALWQVPESDVFPPAGLAMLGEVAPFGALVPSPEESLVAVAINERGRIRVMDASYWEKWAVNLPAWARM